MRMSVAIFLCALVSVCSTALAVVSETANSAAEAARSYGAAVRSCDMGWALDYMYPPLKRMYAEQFAGRGEKEADNARRIMGLAHETPQQARTRVEAGMRALREHYVKMGKQMISSGLKIESFTVREPVAEYVLTPLSGRVIGSSVPVFSSPISVGTVVERSSVSTTRLYVPGSTSEKE